LCATLIDSRYNITTTQGDKMEYYERIDGRKVPVRDEEDIKTAEFEELCDMNDGTIGLCALTIIFCLLTIVFV
jgi:hypothetical protein